MQQKRVGDKLYVLDMVPYTITEDTDASIIYVQQEKLAGYLELNPTLADKITTTNYLTFSVRKKDWVDDGPEPTPKKDPEIALNNSFLGFSQGDTGNLSDIISNPNELDYNVSLVRATTGETYDIANNDYFTVDALSNYTVHNTYNYDLALVISRAEDDEWLEAGSRANTVIYPSSEEKAEQVINAESTFDEQTNQLDMYLDAEIIANMDAEGVKDLAANLINYRYVLTADIMYGENDYRIGVRFVTSWDDNGPVVRLIETGTEYYEPLIIFTITPDGSEDVVVLSENIQWLNLHKPASSDILAVDLDGYSADGSQTKVLAVPEVGLDEPVWVPAFAHNVNDLKVLMYPGEGFVLKVMSGTGGVIENNVSSSYESYIAGGYSTYMQDWDGLGLNINPEFPTIPLPTYIYGMPYILLKDSGETGRVLTVDKPEGETWYADLVVASDKITPITTETDNIPNIWLKSGNGVELYLNGAKGQTGNKATAVSGIQQSDITDSSFNMPDNDVEVSVQYMPTYEVDLHAQLSAHAGLEPADISDVTPTIESYDTPHPFGNFEGSDNIPYTYVGLYDTGEVDENKDPIYDIYNLGATDITWTCDIPGVTIEYDDVNTNKWMITVATGTTLDGTETVSVSIVDGYEVPNFGYITGTKIYSFNPALPQPA